MITNVRVPECMAPRGLSAGAHVDPDRPIVSAELFLVLKSSMVWVPCLGRPHASCGCESAADAVSVFRLTQGRPWVAVHLYLLHHDGSQRSADGMRTE